MKLVIIVVLGLFVQNAFGAKDLPHVFKKCQLGSENFNNCMKDALNDALPKIKTYYKKLGLPILEPLVLKSATFEQKGSGPVNINQKYSNVKLFNVLSLGVCEKYDVDRQNHELHMTLSNPLLKLSGNYELKGQILILPVRGKGNFSMAMTNLTSIQTFKYKEVERDGDIYWYFTSATTHLKTDRLEVDYGNLFNGNKELGDAMNKMINENWEVVFQEVEPQYSLFYSSASLKLMNLFYNQYPISKIHSVQMINVE